MLEDEEMDMELDKVIGHKETSKTVKKPKNVYLRRMQDKLKRAIESGMLNVEQQYGMIESTIDELLSVKMINEDAVEQHDNEIKRLVKQIEDIQKQVSERYKKTYTKILEL